jgi:hypothetical protein
MALALPKHVRDKQRLRGMMHKQLSRHFHDCDGADRVRHLDERTFQQEARGKRPRTAIPNDLRLEAVDVMFQPLPSPCLVIEEAYNRVIGCSSIYRSIGCSFRHLNPEG